VKCVLCGVINILLIIWMYLLLILTTYDMNKGVPSQVEGDTSEIKNGQPGEVRSCFAALLQSSLVYLLTYLLTHCSLTHSTAPTRVKLKKSGATLRRFAHAMSRVPPPPPQTPPHTTGNATNTSDVIPEVRPRKKGHNRVNTDALPTGEKLTQRLEAFMV